MQLKQSFIWQICECLLCAKWTKSVSRFEQIHGLFRLRLCLENTGCQKACALSQHTLHVHPFLLQVRTCTVCIPEFCILTQTQNIPPQTSIPKHTPSTQHLHAESRLCPKHTPAQYTHYTKQDVLRLYLLVSSLGSLTPHPLWLEPALPGDCPILELHFTVLPPTPWLPIKM